MTPTSRNSGPPSQIVYNLKMRAYSSGNETSVESTALPGQSGAQLKSVAERLERLACSGWLHILVLVAIVWGCFAVSLQGFFLADDLSQVEYVYKATRGQPAMIWSMFTRNYIWGASIKFYRPLVMVSFLADFLMWGINPFGYHLTNLAFYTADVVLCYLVARQLTSDWPRWRSSLASFFGAALFASSPLHSESVSWLSGRTDIISTFFCLIALYWLMKAGNGSLRVIKFFVAVPAFWMALIAKEMAVGLPLIVAALGFLWPDRGICSSELDKRRFTGIRSAIRLSLPFWITLVVYMLVRACALGTFAGGYSTNFRYGLFAAGVNRFLDPGTLYRLVIPISTCVSGGAHTLEFALGFCYLCLAIVMVLRLPQIPAKLLMFLAIWIFCAAAPLYELWGLGPALESARLYFFLTVPLSLLWPIVAFQPARAKRSGGKHGSLTWIAFPLTSVILVTAVVASGQAALAQNLLWLDGANEVREVALVSQELSQLIPPGFSVIVLGLPVERCGVHMLMNGLNYDVLLSRPFSPTYKADRFLSFLPLNMGRPDLISATRLKSCLSKSNVLGTLVWDGAHNRFAPVSLTSAPRSRPEELILFDPAAEREDPVVGRASHQVCEDRLELNNVAEGDELRFTGLRVNPLREDFLEFEIRCTQPAAPAEIEVTWTGGPEQTAGQPDSQEQLDGKETSDLICNSGNRVAVAIDPQRDSNFHLVRIRLSHYWRWHATVRITALTLRLFPCKHMEIKGIRLVSDDRLVPKLAINGVLPTTNGICLVPRKPFRIDVDAKNVPGAKAVEVEFSYPDFSFDSAPANNLQSAIGLSMRCASPIGRLMFTPAALPASGCYEVRARAISGSGQPIGEYCDPIGLRW